MTEYVYFKTLSDQIATPLTRAQAIDIISNRPTSIAMVEHPDVELCKLAGKLLRESYQGYMAFTRLEVDLWAYLSEHDAPYDLSTKEVGMPLVRLLNDTDIVHFELWR